MKPMKNAVLLTLSLALTAVACEEKKEEAPASADSSAAEDEEKEEEPKIHCKDDKNKKTDKDGNVTSCILEKDSKVGEYTCEGGKTFSQYGPGKLKGCFLTEEKVTNGVPCKEFFDLHPDGALRRCKITKDHTINEIEVPAGSWISLDKEGKLSRIEVKQATEMQGMKCTGYFNYFHPNGKLKRCKLAEETEIDGAKIAKDEDVCFDDGGKKADC